MAEVTGSIGNEYVELNNAATESTLRLLLQSSLAANKQTIDSISKIATKAGIDPATVAATNLNISSLGRQAFMLGAAWGGLSTATDTLRKNFSGVNDLLTELTSGGAEASKVLSIMGRIGGPLGLVLDGMSRLAAFQEQQLKSYQSLTSAGVNFGGSLTDLRMAASSTYMTMDSFSNLMKTNGESFAKMGNSANDGAVAFTRVASALQRGEVGDKLRALGFTTEEANQGLANYITMTGGRNAQEMRDTKALSTAAGEYLTQLDALATITGKSREQQENALKEASLNQAYQSYLLTLDEKERAKANAALVEANARGGKGAVEALQSRFLGLAPATKAAQEFTVYAQRGAQSIGQLADNVKDATKTVQDQRMEGARMGVAVAKDTEAGSTAYKAIVMMGGQGAATISDMMKSSNQLKNQGIKTEADAEAQVKKISEEQRKREASQAADAAETKKALNELGLSIMEKLMPAVASMLSVFNPLIQGLAGFVGWISESKIALTVLLGATTALTAAFIAAKVAQARKEAAALIRGSPGSPMYVLVTNPGGGGGGIDIEAPDGKDDKGGKGGKGKLLKGLKGFGVGAAVGIGSDLAADALGRDTKSGAGADVLGTAAGMAGTGALLGSFLGPAGTAIGAGIGGAAGAGLGLYQNWGTLFGENKNNQVPTLPKASDSAVIKDVKESVAPLRDPKIEMAAMETLRTELQTLNKQSAEMLKYIKDTTDYTRRTFDATSALSGNHFKR
jgi:hypothetical protein